MKFTLKLINGEGSSILTTEGGVMIKTPSDEDFWDHVPDGHEPRAVLLFNYLDSGHVVNATRYLYEGDKAYIMNDSGKTVACI